MDRHILAFVVLLGGAACVFDGEVVELTGASTSTGGIGGAPPSTSSSPSSSNASASLASTGGSGAGEGGAGGMPEPYFDCDLSGPVVAVELHSWELGTCARSSDGSVDCWGYDSWGQLGRGEPFLSGDPNPVTVPLPGPAYRLDVSLAGCAVVGDCHAPELHCWGRNIEGQAGQPIGADQVIVPTKVPLPGAVYDVATGGTHTCALVDDAGTRRVFCWGNSAAGQCGIISPTSVLPTEVPLAAGEVPTAIFAGVATTCVRVESNGIPDGLRCWGDNSAAMLGNIGPNSPTPTVHPDVTGATGVAVDGGTSGCMFAPEGLTSWAGCWGSNANGQIDGGPGDTDPNPVPQLTPLPATVVDVENSLFGVLARTLNGGWFAIGEARLVPGLDPAAPKLTSFTVAPALDQFVTATVSGNYCAVDPNGDVYCWGNFVNHKGCMGPSFNAANVMHYVPLP